MRQLTIHMNKYSFGKYLEFNKKGLSWIVKNINEIAKIIKLNGGNLYLVGGAIRDKLLGIANHDEDYCVTGLSFDEFSRLFPEAFVRGKDFPVFSIDNMEFAIARKERKADTTRCSS